MIKNASQNSILKHLSTFENNFSNWEKEYANAVTATIKWQRDKDKFGSIKGPPGASQRGRPEIPSVSILNDFALKLYKDIQSPYNRLIADFGEESIKVSQVGSLIVEHCLKSVSFYSKDLINEAQSLSFNDSFFGGHKFEDSDYKNLKKISSEFNKLKKFLSNLGMIKVDEKTKDYFKESTKAVADNLNEIKQSIKLIKDDFERIKNEKQYNQRATPSIEKSKSSNSNIIFWIVLVTAILIYFFA
tara:strand:+ start:16 stop:750 length:735 start_codon:yes stop_codon:yes gene_type:complete